MIQNWYFHKGALEGGELRELDHSLFSAVNVPHTWNAQDGQDGCPGAKSNKDTDYYRGDSWYRAFVTLSVEDADKRLFLRFQGVNTECDVYMNEKYVGSHQGGYTAFCLDISPYLHFGDDNLLAVRVTNARNPAIAPLQADFTFYGGIYRDVELIKKEKTAFCCTEWGTRGLTVTTPSVTKEKAVCRAEALVENALTAERKVVVKAEIGGAEQSKELTLAPGELKKVVFTFEIESPHLWNGRKDPYLYSLNATLWEEDQLLDTITEEVGLRFYHVDKEKGFFLNGESYPLRGVSRHQDREGLGNALTTKEHDEDFSMIYDIGVTAVRLAHYPQAEYFYRLCDRNGILVWAEIPFVDFVGGNGSYQNPDKDRAEFFKITKQQLTELIRQNQNHPAIFCWGLQNEVIAKHNDVMIPFMEELYALAKAEDPYRLTTQATNQTTAYNWKSDLIAWNVYPGWYGMSRKQLGWFMDKNKTDRPLGISEYGAGGNHLQHEARPRKPKHDGQWHPEEYQALCHEAFLQQIEKRDYLWCTFVWNMFDFGSDCRNEGDRPGMNDKGLVSFDRKVKKDAFYVYQSHWSEKPMLHIAGQRFQKRPKKSMDIKVYSNMEQIEIRINGKKAGVKTQGQNKQRCVFLWKRKKLQKGENRITAVGTLNGVTLEQEAVFYYQP